MPTPKKKPLKQAGAAVDGTVPCPHDKGKEGGFESRTAAQAKPTPDEVMLADYPNVHNDIPGLLRAILRELVTMRASK